MTHSPPDHALAELIVDMDERGSLGAIRRRLDAGDDPLVLLDECRVGMERVGDLYERGTYFISALIMAGEIFREAAEILVPLLPAPPQPQGSGTIVIATVQGDIHDIGKNIAITLLDAHGFTVVDLGVDVAPARIAEAVANEQPDVLARALDCSISEIRSVAADIRGRAPRFGRECQGRRARGAGPRSRTSFPACLHHRRGRYV